MSAVADDRRCGFAHGGARPREPEGKSAITPWLLEALPTVTFVVAKTVGILAVIRLGTAATVDAAFRVARSEELLLRDAR